MLLVCRDVVVLRPLTIKVCLVVAVPVLTVAKYGIFVPSSTCSQLIINVFAIEIFN